MHALGGSGCAIQCVSTQSSLYRSSFCNPHCFIEAWKTQYTIRDAPQSSRNWNGNSAVLHHKRQTSDRLSDYGSVDDESTGSIGAGSNASLSSNNKTTKLSKNASSFNDFGASQYEVHESNGEWTEISRDAVYCPTADDVGRKLKLEAGASSIETGELLMHRVIKSFPRYCQGAGFALSRRFLECSGGDGQHIAKARFMPFEDVAMGLIAQRCDVTPTMVEDERMIQTSEGYSGRCTLWS